MKNIIASAIIAFGFFAHSVSAADNPSFRVSESDSSKGTLSMRALDVEGEEESIENVNIELDFRNSTFRVLNTGAASNSSSASEPIKSNTANEITVAIQGCTNTNRVVTCNLLITNNEFDDEINFCADSGSSFCGPNSRSTATDSFNNIYTASQVSIAGESSRARVSDFMLLADTPTAATIEFKNVSSRATSFPLLQLFFGKYSGSERGINQVIIEFKDVAF
ncbi:MAG: hypothetical protein GQ581_01780 [Methyloprofundus sp.]|nr:hypothetical protein [Methyloprofundus sp.]